MPNQHRILCIEDDPGTGELLVEELTEAGYRVHLVESGRAGVDAILSFNPDLVLCDIDLPQLSGFDVLEKIRQNGGAGRTMPFVFLTAYGHRENQIRARKLGCDDYVTKPIDFELLIEVIRNQLARNETHDTGAPEVQLTGREVEALSWSARGKSSADIGVLMGVSERTVNFHIDNAIRKLGVATRIQAAVKGALLGLIRP